VVLAVAGVSTGPTCNLSTGQAVLLDQLGRVALFLPAV
jgi:hypothetical protein